MAAISCPTFALPSDARCNGGMKLNACNDGIAGEEHPYRREHNDRAPRVTISIITRQKPQLLERALDSLRKMEAPGRTQVRILVVDNDERMSSYATVINAQMCCPYPIAYVVEGRPGIPQARNRAVAESRTEDYIIFIDDDESIGTPHWLGLLLDCQRRFSADVVQGPVYPNYLESPPSWVVRGEFFSAAEFPTGYERQGAASGNTLMVGSLFHCMERWFDERFPFLGKTDNEFFARAALRGAKIVWCREAWVYEAIPPERCTARWLFRRAYKIGNAPATMRRFGVYGGTSPSMAIGRKVLLLTTLARSSLQIAIGLVKLVLRCIQRDRAEAVREGMFIACAAGRIVGASGGEFNYYRPE